ncbi:MAG: cytochrome c3 family protein [Planctomycetaceae bacterium]
MHRRMMNLVLLVGAAIGLIVLAAGASAWRLPDNQQGYAPEQPIAYSHRLHAGELGIDCQFCHSAASRGHYAGIPSADVCLKCHKYVTSSFDRLQQELTQADAEKRKPQLVISDDLKPLYAALRIEDPQQPVTDPRAGIPWVRVHHLPDYVAFDHRAHVAAGVTCQKCHGPVESMERIRQAEPLSMGWCVNCHREATEQGINGHPVHASINCSTCHY